MGPNWPVCGTVGMAVLPSSGDAAQLSHCFDGGLLPRCAGQEVALDLGAPPPHADIFFSFLSFLKGHSAIFRRMDSTASALLCTEKDYWMLTFSLSKFIY